MAEALNVFWDRRLVGRIRLDSKRAFIFQYDVTWVAAPDAIPLSLRLPLGQEQFPPDAARPFFTNLLPEANVRAHIARKLGVSEKNDFKMNFVPNCWA